MHDYEAPQRDEPWGNSHDDLMDKADAGYYDERRDTTVRALRTAAKMLSAVAS